MKHPLHSWTRMLVLLCLTSVLRLKNDDNQRRQASTAAIVVEESLHNRIDSSSADLRSHEPANMTSQPHSDWLRVPFPRWSGGIQASQVLQAVEVSLSGRLRKDRVGHVYIIDREQNLGKYAVPRDKPDASLRRRSNRMEELWLHMLDTVSFEEYPHLNKAIVDGGLVFLANNADSKFCAHESLFIDNNEDILIDLHVPVLTLSAPVACSFSFPLPTYEFIKQAQKPWTKLVPQYQNDYPWEEKKSMAVWRGAPTGNSKNNTRVQLCELSNRRRDLIDARLTRRRRISFKDYDESIYLGDKIPMVDFQNYKAIVDVDGHSWSSRFAELLCYSSVVLKVSPDFVDYFYSELQPWIHYIPVSHDLSNLYDRVEFVMNVKNTDAVQRIIRAANTWCLSRMSYDQLARDTAHVLDVYASHCEGPIDIQTLWETNNFTTVT